MLFTSLKNINTYLIYIQILADTFASVNEIKQNIFDLTLYEFVSVFNC